MPESADEELLLRIAEAVRDACVEAALDGHEQAGFGGLCGEGRWEMAVDSMREVDLRKVVRKLTTG